MAKFVKIAELDEQSRKKLKDFWSPLWGKEYAEAITKDYGPTKAKSEKTESKN